MQFVERWQRIAIGAAHEVEDLAAQRRRLGMRGVPRLGHDDVLDAEQAEASVPGKVLFRGNDPAPLTPKAVETLLVLVERQGQVVTKDELIRIVWPDTFVEENNLAQNISLLRRVLGESGGPQFIETVPKRGYRFVGPVVEQAATDHGAVAVSATEPTLQTRRTSLMSVLAAAGVAAAILASVAVWRSMGSVTALQSIAVMTFDEMGLDQAHQYSGDGIADELTTQLGRESGLKVAARTSAFALRDRKMDAREIGRTLGVDALLEGSVLQAKDRVRIAVRVVNTRDGYQILVECVGPAT